jgi:hypothetical protein
MTLKKYLKGQVKCKNSVDLHKDELNSTDLRAYKEREVVQNLLFEIERLKLKVLQLY